MRIVVLLAIVAGCSSSGGADPSAAAMQPELTRIAGRLASPEWQGRDEGSPGGIAARAFIIEEWKKCGIVPAVAGGFEQPVATGKGANVVGKIVGTDASLKDRYVLVSAHYDHLGVGCGVASDTAHVCLGAYDNAIAVAEVIETACALARNPPRRSVLVAHWDAEEPPTFLTDKMGSAFYVANPLVPLSQVDVAIVLDLTGEDLWPGYQTLVVLGSETSAEVAAAVKAAKVPSGLPALRLGLHAVEEQVFGHHPWSDYDDFRKKGVPVLFLSDGQNKVYHTPQDTADRLDIPKAGREAAFLLSVARNLADASATPAFKLENDYPNDAKTALRVVQDALAPGGMVEKLSLTDGSKSLLEGDLAALKTTVASLDAGNAATDADISAIRKGIQRGMCLASTLPELLCSAL